MATARHGPVKRVPGLTNAEIARRVPELHRRLRDPESMHRLATLLFGHEDSEWRKEVEAR